MNTIPSADAAARLLYLVAHPDDAEFLGGGLATLHARRGSVVKFVSLTNGDAGHHLHAGPQLAERRRKEAEEAAAVIGATAEVWSHHDGCLQPTLELRWQVVREIRRFKPDLVLTHRTNDYHPDHRAVGTVVQDACYLVTVPALAADTPALARDPVVAFLPDRFTKPVPLAGDVVLDVGECADTIVEMLACHRSQFFEWLPFNLRIADQVPEAETAGSDRARRAWLKTWYLDHLRPQADRYRRELVARYGESHGRRIEFAEVYEISEYAAPLNTALEDRLFLKRKREA
ncbi:MAG TPA: PIG-L deacetylase family protein [Pirellulales bacterium]|nr:PIG-L deacetylase family protein [Pirellulales bacterium]